MFEYHLDREKMASNEWGIWVLENLSLSEEHAQKAHEEGSLFFLLLNLQQMRFYLEIACEWGETFPGFERVAADLEREYECFLSEMQEKIREAMRYEYGIIEKTGKYAGLKDTAKQKSIEFKKDIDKYWDLYDRDTILCAQELIFDLSRQYGGVYNDFESVSAFLHGAEDFDALDGRAFEYWCANLLKRNGYSIMDVTKGSGDQGVDIIAEKEGIRYAVQCKCFSADLGNTPGQEVYAGKTFYQCHLGVVMTNRFFTKSARELARATGTLLWDRDKINDLIKNAEKEDP